VTWFAFEAVGHYYATLVDRHSISTLLFLYQVRKDSAQLLVAAWDEVMLTDLLYAYHRKRKCYPIVIDLIRNWDHTQ